VRLSHDFTSGHVLVQRLGGPKDVPSGGHVRIEISLVFFLIKN